MPGSPQAATRSREWTPGTRTTTLCPDSPSVFHFSTGCNKLHEIFNTVYYEVGFVLVVFAQLWANVSVLSDVEGTRLSYDMW